jgi:thiol-disulfide isomerase/thioredoxin
VTPSRLGAAVLVAVCTLTASGCAGGGPLPSAPDLGSHVDVDTPDLRAAKAKIGVQPCPHEDGPGSDLPDLTLACLGGGREVDLSDISGPAVVQLWASWCVSCPDELPLFQRLSDEHGDQLTVLGVDWQDTQPGKAMELLDLTDAKMPQLADPGGDLAEHYRLTGLPGILLVDKQGDVTFKLMRLDDYDQLLSLVQDHTGVPVAAG